MPIYEYLCQNCGATAEKLEKISAPEIQTCQQCLQNTMTRQISQSSFALKGDGWYVTDFKDKKDKKSKTSEPAE